MHFNLIACFKHCSRIKSRAMMFATILTVANANPDRTTYCRKLNSLTKTASGKLIHIRAPNLMGAVKVAGTAAAVGVTNPEDLYVQVGAR
jgi:hypothetical protein